MSIGYRVGFPFVQGTPFRYNSWFCSPMPEFARRVPQGLRPVHVSGGPAQQAFGGRRIGA
jgi:hypothetical protein